MILTGRVSYAYMSRSRYVTTVGATPGVPSVLPAPTEESFNLISTARGRGFATLDHDDGSSFYYDHHNVLLYGGIQNLGGYNNTAAANLFIEPCTMEYGPGAYTCDNLDDAQEGHRYVGNTCMCNQTQTPYRLLDATTEAEVPRSGNNSFLFGSQGDTAAIEFGCLWEHPGEAVAAAEAVAAPIPTPCKPPPSSKSCPAGAHCATCKAGSSSQSDCLSCAHGYTFTAVAPPEPDCTGYCLANCTPPKTKTDCPAGAHCKTCRDGPNVKVDDCITCEAGFPFQPAIPGGEPDCTGTCGTAADFCEGGKAFSLPQWQAKGQELGSVEGVMPPHTEVIAMARALLGMPRS
jgi:hypothetical protein